jgi:hypothetical protein
MSSTRKERKALETACKWPGVADAAAAAVAAAEAAPAAALAAAVDAAVAGE